MKTKVLLFVGCVLLSTSMFSQRGVRIAYVDMEYILENVEEYREATEQLAERVQRWKIEIEQKQSEIDQMKSDLMAEKVLLTEELIAEREEDIQILETEMIEYQQNRFGPKGDLVLQKQRLIQPIQDQVFNEVQTIGTNKKYDFIFDKSADVVMLYSQKRHDISELVLRGISRTRRVSKPKGKPKRKTELENFEGEEEEVSDALLERQEKAKQAQEARIKSTEERREEQLRLREERKKAYEERRNKLLQEREAKRKEKELERKAAAEKKENSEN